MRDGISVRGVSFAIFYPKPRNSISQRVHKTTLDNESSSQLKENTIMPTPDAQNNQDKISTLDELFYRSAHYHTSQNYKEALDFLFNANSQQYS